MSEVFAFTAALTHKNLDFTKKKYAQFLPESLAQIGNAAAEVLEFNGDCDIV